MMIGLGLFVVSVGLFFFILLKNYHDTAYYQITHQSYFAMKDDLGKQGEYLIYKELRFFEEHGARFLFNAYLPKEDGETTEIDILMISPKGIFVFESKNYSGWIFGEEEQLYWYQTLPSGKGALKKQFYNPIMQNKLHVSCLRKHISECVPIESVIVFSDHCELKNIKLSEHTASVLQKHELREAVSYLWQRSEVRLTDHEVIAVYNHFYPYTQVSEEDKAKHRTHINNQFKNP